jgi:hypothetical protein
VAHLLGTINVRERCLFSGILAYSPYLHYPVTVLPFKEGYRYIVVPWSIARNVMEKLSEYPKDHFDAKSILTEALGPAVEVGQPSAQAPFSLMSSKLTPGYVTEDVSY